MSEEKPKVYLVRVTGEIYVSGNSHSDVKECLKGAQLACTGSKIKFLDIDRIQTSFLEGEEHGHGTGAVRPVATPAPNPQSPSLGRGQPASPPSTD
jgi:hypothetical protein